MGGIEHTVWVKIGDDEKICAIANEDLERSSEEKASAVHFMRFEIESQAILSIRAGAPVQMGIDHPALPYRGGRQSINLDQLSPPISPIRQEAKISIY